MAKWIDAAPAASVLRRLAPAIFKRLDDRERFARALETAPAVVDAT